MKAARATPARPRRAIGSRRTQAKPTRATIAGVGIDTGGTFTDFVAVVNGRVTSFKLPSTPAAPERAVQAGLERLAARRGTPVRHGSTVATNALLERKGARVAFVTTAGFEDVLEIGRQHRPDLYALAPRRPEPLVPRARRIGVRERLGPDGRRWRALAPRDIAAAVRATRRARPEAIAVGLLHAYADPAHERRLARALASLGVPVTAATDLCPEIREYERFATTAANAYLVPRVARYLGALARATGPAFEVVLSHGGTAPAQRAAREPARQLLSGPAAGVRAALDAALAIGYRAALTLDVGGTSTDCAFLDGALPRRRGREIAGIPIQLPMIDVHTIGAGGGSIARVDSGGLLRVGPESAGADPGPACYGRGGPPTVTDALVVTGRIPGEALAGGTFPIERAAARRAMEALARQLGHGDAVRAAEGVVRVAESHMSAALRLVSVERGHDPRRAVLVCYGGAGGLFACALAAELGAAVWFPRHAGVFSALGALTGGSRREHARTVMLDARDRAGRRRVLDELERAARRDLGAGRGPVAVERRAEVRARGQAHELSIDASGDVVAAFHAEHARRFGFANLDAAVEIVTLEVRVSRPGVRLPIAPPRVRRAPSRGAAVAVRHGGRTIAARVWEADAAPRALRGPALVIEDGATLWIAPGWRARRMAGGLLLEMAGGGR